MPPQREEVPSCVLFGRPVSVLFPRGLQYKGESRLNPVLGTAPRASQYAGQVLLHPAVELRSEIKYILPKEVNFKAVFWFILCSKCICTVYSALFSTQWLREHLYIVRR